ncbi:MAG: hypothetical protein JWO35_804 [Candidatus Saccharibacteria bacterium]|nr:hypothetical protein [Candidatus Saccharibacteria bacterium]
MEDLSEEAIKKDCPHCSLASQAYLYSLGETSSFRIVCDAHPLKEGHILVIPKAHLSCIGEYEPGLLQEFKELYDKVSTFVQVQYGSVATFEHGVFGQTVFHSHIHFLPFTGSPDDIVPEGAEKRTPLADLSELQELYKGQGGYLFFSIGKDMWTVDTDLAEPRFFRDRFASAIGHPERGSWKEMHQNAETMEIVEKENLSVQENWITA